MKGTVFWVVNPCSSERVRRFIGKYLFHIQDRIVSSACHLVLLVSLLGTLATNWPIVPAPDDRWWVWSSQWNENWQGKRSTWRKPAPVLHFPPQIPMTWSRTRVAAVGSRRLTSWAMPRPFLLGLLFHPEDRGSVFLENGRLSPNLKTLQQKAVVIWFQVVSRHCLEGLSKTGKNVS
jgi:hypothetical protein